jgi:hypothetical protein
MYKPSSYLVVTYFPTYLPTYIQDLFFMELVYQGENQILIQLRFIILNRVNIWFHHGKKLCSK